MSSNKTCSFERICSIMKLSVHWGPQFPVAIPDILILYAGMSRLFSQRIREAVWQWFFLFLSDSIIAVIKKCISYHIMSTSRTSWNYFFTTSPSLSTYFFSPIFMWNAVCRNRKTLCWSVGDFTRAVLQLVRKRRPLRVSFRGPRKMEFGRC